MTTPLRLLAMVAFGATLCAQGTDTPAKVPAALPYRLEVGGYGVDFNNGGGLWRGANATLWIRKNPRFIPALTFDSRTSDAGTQRYYAFFSYANWTPNFFTTQSVSGTDAGGTTRLLFPRFRYDVKAWWKLPPRRSLVAGVGVSRYTLGSAGSGTMINPGLLFYKGSFVLDGEVFFNRTSPGALWSGSGLFAIQQGHEGRHWAGMTIGVGRQAYRELALAPLEVRYSSFSADLFYRKWLTRNFGIAVSGGFQDARNSYQRYSFSTRAFFEF